MDPVGWKLCPLWYGMKGLFLAFSEKKMRQTYTVYISHNCFLWFELNSIT